ncbi:uncharacterized protein LOC103514629 [Diaphorina citri]|uniref:Uncharacterized protein LOC103514629 n=1 Tax=Diaphorina citri TaxID=121845 RepID=A0A1S3DAK7_DIACI|nr:uncharacterized protein LOC103514629 [Diaphorina citri]
MTNVTPGLLVLTISLLINLLHGVESIQIPGDKVPQVVKDAIPKHIKAMYKAHKATYAKDYAYKLIPIPNKPPPTPLDKSTTVVPSALSRSTRTGRQAWTSHYPKVPPSRSRRRKVRPQPMRMTYSMPTPYASKYKSYSPMYKKRQRYSPPRMVASGRYPAKYRMPVHNNVIEPMDDYQDEEVEMMEEEPIVMESMGPSYVGGTMPIMSGMGGSMGQMALMGPAQNEEMYVSEYDDMSSVRMPSRPVEYVADDDYAMRHSDFYSSGYNSGLRGRGTQMRAVKPSNVMYSSRYRDLRNSETRYEPEIMQRRPMKQIPDFASSPQYSNSPQYSSNQPMYDLETKYRSNFEDSDFLSSNLRVKSELPDYLRATKYEAVEDAKDGSIELFSRQQPTAQPSADSNKWGGSMKFMPRPFASTLESGHSNPSGRNVSPKKNPEVSSTSNHNTGNNYKKFNYDTSSSHIKQPALTIHDLLLQQAKQIQQTSHDVQSSPAQGRDLSDDYTNINEFMVYTGPHPGDVYKTSAQKYRSNESTGMSRRSTGGESTTQYHRYSKPEPDLDDIDTILDSLPWKVEK